MRYKVTLGDYLLFETNCFLKAFIKYTLFKFKNPTMKIKLYCKI